MTIRELKTWFDNIPEHLDNKEVWWVQPDSGGYCSHDYPIKTPVIQEFGSKVLITNLDNSDNTSKILF